MVAITIETCQNWSDIPIQTGNLVVGSVGEKTKNRLCKVTDITEVRGPYLLYRKTLEETGIDLDWISVYGRVAKRVSRTESTG